VTAPSPPPGTRSEGEGVPDLNRLEAWDYPLPPGRIARYPAQRRDESRLLVVPPARSGSAAGLRPGEASPGADPERSPFRHLVFSELPTLLAPGDLLVLNESRVLPVRLLGRKPTGAACEVLLLHPLDEDAVTWEALVRPGSKLKPGRRVVVAPGELEVVVEEGLPDGSRRVRLESSLPPEAALECFGHIPLPPYLEREEEPVDRIRYQTVYARVPGSAAAPTAGLHFTPELLAEIEGRGVGIARVLLHVGAGTFRPVESERVEDHQMHREHWEIPPEAAEAVARTRARGGRIWAVGTTVVRTLESAADEAGGVAPGGGETRLFIRPGYPFRVVDGLITNFHLPRSTLLMLVAALAGYRRTMDAYAEAVREGYRFFSYGDAMVIPPAADGPEEAERAAG
jgi:S-adenosylmethionine:tRNA ribosyltransferase-isomerase